VLGVGPIGEVRARRSVKACILAQASESPRVIWNGYALMLGSMALILPNVLGLTMNVMLTSIAVAVRHPRLAREQQAESSVPCPRRMAEAVVENPELGAELAALIVEHEAAKLADADTLIMRPGAVPAYA